MSTDKKPPEIHDLATNTIIRYFHLLLCGVAYFGYFFGWFGFRETLFSILILIAILAHRAGGGR